jgi:hypothetical protein
MPRSGILLPVESPDVTFRRYHLYTVTFGALGSAFQLTALSSDLMYRSPSFLFLILGLSAILTGVLALVLKNRAMLALKAATTEAIDQEAMLSIAKWRAARSAPTSGVNLHTLLPSFDERQKAPLSVAKRGAERKSAKKFDPWAKILEDTTARKQR